MTNGSNGEPFVFHARNNHVPNCGEPPGITNDDDHYFGYFENQHGEQCVCVIDRKTGRGTLRSGDAHWSGKHRIIPPGEVPTLFLNEHEAGWLRLCWAAAVGHVRAMQVL